MSYNVTQWKTKKLDNLVIPLAAFYKHERKDWHPGGPVLCDIHTKEVKMGCGCGQEIKGVLTGEELLVTELEMSGEGSGTFLDWILEPALKESRGQLEAVLVWEGGDSITRLTVDDGVVTQSKVEL